MAVHHCGVFENMYVQEILKNWDTKVDMMSLEQCKNDYI